MVIGRQQRQLLAQGPCSPPFLPQGGAKGEGEKDRPRTRQVEVPPPPAGVGFPWGVGVVETVLLRGPPPVPSLPLRFRTLL